MLCFSFPSVFLSVRSLFFLLFFLRFLFSSLSRASPSSSTSRPSSSISSLCLAFICFWIYPLGRHSPRSPLPACLLSTLALLALAYVALSTLPVSFFSSFPPLVSSCVHSFATEENKRREEKESRKEGRTTVSGRQT